MFHRQNRTRSLCVCTAHVYAGATSKCVRCVSIHVHYGCCDLLLSTAFKKHKIVIFYNCLSIIWNAHMQPSYTHTHVFKACCQCTVDWPMQHSTTAACVCSKSSVCISVYVCVCACIYKGERERSHSNVTEGWFSKAPALHSRLGASLKFHGRSARPRSIYENALPRFMENTRAAEQADGVIRQRSELTAATNQAGLSRFWWIRSSPQRLQSHVSL